MRAVKYGVTRNYVMALELVKSDGTVITVGTKNRKDTTGLNLKDIVIGSEGTLAIITKCLLRLIGKPEKSLSVLVGFNSLKAGIEAVPKILKANLNPTALEFIERKVVKLGEDFLKIKFPLESQSGMQMISFGHAGDGNVHLCVVRGNRSDEEWETELHANLEKLYAKAHNLEGLISGEHGLGVSKRDFFFKETPAANVALMNSVKQAFDPQGILNPKISYVN